MVKVSDNCWKHKNHAIFKKDGWYISGWAEMVNPFRADTLEGMRKLINESLKSKV